MEGKSISEQADEILAEESTYLYKDLSQIPNAGQGLFTAIPIYKDEIICTFQGEILSEAESSKRIAAKTDQYFINLLDGTIMDSRLVSCFAKFANDAKGPGNTAFKNNSKISLDENGNVCLIAKRNIKAGEEIFCSYGKRYWKKHGTH